MIIIAEKNLQFRFPGRTQDRRKAPVVCSLVAKVCYDTEDIGYQCREDGKAISQEETRGFVGINIHIGGLLNHGGDVWPMTELVSLWKRI